MQGHIKVHHLIEHSLSHFTCRSQRHILKHKGSLLRWPTSETLSCRAAGQKERSVRSWWAPVSLLVSQFHVASLSYVASFKCRHRRLTSLKTSFVNRRQSGDATPDASRPWRAGWWRVVQHTDKHKKSFVASDSKSTTPRLCSCCWPAFHEAPAILPHYSALPAALAVLRLPEAEAPQPVFFGSGLLGVLAPGRLHPSPCRAVHVESPSLTATSMFCALSTPSGTVTHRGADGDVALWPGCFGTQGIFSLFHLCVCLFELLRDPFLL